MEEIMIKINLKLTGQRIKAFREKLGISIVEATKMLGFGSTQILEGFEKGHAFPKVDVLLKLAEMLHVKVDDIISYQRL